MAAAACGGWDSGLAAGGYRGAELRRPLPKPDFTLTATDGSRFPFREGTEGYLTLLYFGYTHCPDVCPVHMANLAAVMKQLPYDVTSRIRVVFVTTDPARDTPERLRAWLGAFDPSFIGLTGTPQAIDSAQQAAGVLPAQRDTTTNDTNYNVGHAAQVIAYTRDNLGRVMYPFGTRQADWAHDLPLLVEVTGPPIRVTDAYAQVGPRGEMAVAYFRLRNAGRDSLTLSAALVDGAQTARIHRERREGNMVRMEPTGPIPLGPGGSLVLEPGGTHLMIDGLARPIAAGDTLRIRLSFEGQASVTFAARVRRYGD